MNSFTYCRDYGIFNKDVGRPLDAHKSAKCRVISYSNAVVFRSYDTDVASIRLICGEPVLWATTGWSNTTSRQLTWWLEELGIGITAAEITRKFNGEFHGIIDFDLSGYITRKFG